MWPGVLGRFAELRDKSAQSKRNHCQSTGLVADIGSQASEYEAAPERSMQPRMVSDIAQFFLSWIAGVVLLSSSCVFLLLARDLRHEICCCDCFGFGCTCRILL